MRLVAGSGAIRIMVNHAEQKKTRWYYRRRIPEDILALGPIYRDGKPPVIYRSLKTCDIKEATREAQRALLHKSREGFIS